ncbi:MAG: rhodanese-like domain-containing protein [Oculatellaceae cyanobacterium bins.114]|nr:rhodanese-like domain-containing protein [Oculatellaceae cyanobacterium bins.114]
MNVLRSLAWIALKSWIRAKFPEVKQMAIAELTHQLQQHDSSKPLLLDARTVEEFDVSHLPQAHRVDQWMLARGEQQPSIESTQQAIVVYCSVGYRSTRFAQSLQTRGYSNVFNLEGSLFEWVNQGYSVYRTGADGVEQVTQWVHPYNATWGRLLNNTVKQFTPG